MTSVAIVGAGIAGLACAAGLVAEPGVTLQIFDKGRGPGGRAATRRGDGGFQFDHGLRYVTADDPAFDHVLRIWQNEGRVAPWQARFAVVSANGSTPDADETPRFVGVPKMNALIAAESERVHFSEQIKAIERRDKTWFLETTGGKAHGPFDWVVLSIPAPQAVTLLGSAPELQLRADKVVYAPCWAAMAAFGEAVAAPFDAARGEDGPLAWLSRERSKPGRPDREAWVLHGSAAWSRSHLEEDKDQVAGLLLDAMRDTVQRSGGTLPDPTSLTAHRWRYAFVERPLGQPALFDQENRIGACGDWCLGPRVEDAWISGRAMALIIRASR